MASKDDPHIDGREFVMGFSVVSCGEYLCYVASAQFGCVTPGNGKPQNHKCCVVGPSARPGPAIFAMLKILNILRSSP